MTRAVISLGTNTVRMLVVRDLPSGGIEQLEHRQTGTRLGEGLREGGSLLPAAMQRTLDVVADYARAAHDFGAGVACIATSAVRRADNAEAFRERMREIAGVSLEILPGSVEAEASYRGATYGVAHDGKRVAVLDIGGGSTECAVGCDGELCDARSIEVGSVRVAERFPALLGDSPGPAAHAAAARARMAIAALLEPLRAFVPVATVRCVAGTSLTIAAVIAASHVDEVSGSTLKRSDLDAAIDRLLDLHLDERRTLAGMLAQRADILVGGALVLSEALRKLEVERALLEANDLLLGYLLMQGAGR